jgi:hypothetical protein
VWVYDEYGRNIKVKRPQKKLLSKEQAPVISFTRVIEVAPRISGFGGWGPSKWN